MWYPSLESAVKQAGKGELIPLPLPLPLPLPSPLPLLFIGFGKMYELLKCIVHVGGEASKTAWDRYSKYKV